MRQIIETRTAENIRRVRNLVSIYVNHLQGEGRGRRAGHSLDVLRAAVVLLHASNEDFLRSVARWRLPSASTERLRDVPIAGGDGRSPKYDLGLLLEYREQSVAELVDLSVEEYLERSNYNNVRQVSGLLEKIGVEITEDIEQHFTQLTDLMDRRHQIVHRADRDEQGGRGNARVRSISVATVNWWIQAVEGFSADVLGAIDA